MPLRSTTPTTCHMHFLSPPCTVRCVSAVRLIIAGPSDEEQTTYRFPCDAAHLAHQKYQYIRGRQRCVSFCRLRRVLNALHSLFPRLGSRLITSQNRYRYCRESERMNAWLHPRNLHLPTLRYEPHTILINYRGVTSSSVSALHPPLWSRPCNVVCEAVTTFEISTDSVSAGHHEHRVPQKGVLLNLRNDYSSSPPIYGILGCLASPSIILW